jgi:hypothetical protein
LIRRLNKFIFGSLKTVTIWEEAEVLKELHFFCETVVVSATVMVLRGFCYDDGNSNIKNR